MARPKKKGLEYFTNDVNFYQDIKIRKLIRYKGIEAVSVYHILLCQIYSHGYYLPWDKDLPFVLYELSGIQEDKIKEYIDCCIEIGLFDRFLFDNDHVLTSRAIQERYIEISVAAKRKIEYSLPFLIAEVPVKSFNKGNMVISSEQTPLSSEGTTVISEEMQINSEYGTQRKVKESKVKHSSSAVTRTPEGCGGVAAGDQSAFGDVEAEVGELLRSPLWKEQVLMRFKFLQGHESQLDDYLRRWGQEVTISGKHHYSLGDAKHHFNCWMVIQEEKFNNQVNSHGTDTNNGYRSGEDILTGAVGIIRGLRSQSPKTLSDLPEV